MLMTAFRGAEYKKIDDQGLHISVGGKDRLLNVDNVIVCAGQSPLRFARVVDTSTSLPYHVDCSRLLGCSKEMDV